MMTRSPHAPSSSAAQPLTRTATSHGFTLVELLVVIGIIALLIAILMPALAKARTAAVNVQCMSNLRQVAMAAINYATENKGYLPPQDYNNAGNALWQTRLISDAGAGVGPHTVRDVKIQRIFYWGHLYRSGFVKEWRIFYCPFSDGTGEETDQQRYYGKVGNYEGWRSDIVAQMNGQNSNRTRSGYNLNPYLILNLATPSKIREDVITKNPTLTNVQPLHPLKRILACDTLSPKSMHKNSNWNFAMVDGSVVTYYANPSWVAYFDSINGNDGYAVYNNFIEYLTGIQ